MLNNCMDLFHGDDIEDLADIQDVEFVWHKSSEGIRYHDPEYNARRTMFTHAGREFGAYHFATDIDGTAQAEAFIHASGTSPSIAMALDLERAPKGGTVKSSQAIAFVERIYRATGRYPWVYGSDILEEFLKGRSILHLCPIWAARYGKLSPPIQGWHLWQYTDGKVGGFPREVHGVGPVDRSRWWTDDLALARRVWRQGRDGLVSMASVSSGTSAGGAHSDPGSTGVGAPAVSSVGGAGGPVGDRPPAGDDRHVERVVGDPGGDGHALGGDPGRKEDVPQHVDAPGDGPAGAGLVRDPGGVDAFIKGIAPWLNPPTPSELAQAAVDAMDRQRKMAAARTPLLGELRVNLHPIIVKIAEWIVAYVQAKVEEKAGSLPFFMQTAVKHYATTFLQEFFDAFVLKGDELVKEHLPAEFHPKPSDVAVNHAADIDALARQMFPDAAKAVDAAHKAADPNYRPESAV